MKPKIVLVPDGYFPNGESRPRRKAEIVEKRGNKLGGIILLLKYCDTGENVLCPDYAVKPCTGKDGVKCHT